MLNRDEVTLSAGAVKALKVQLGEEVGSEIGQILKRLSEQIVELKRSKVSVTSVVPQKAIDSDANVWAQ